MIPRLLFQCPLCHTNDSLLQRSRWLRPDLIECRTCETHWEVRRVVGEDYHLRVIAGPEELLGKERPLFAWFEDMRRGFQLTPITDQQLSLREEEELYLVGDGISLLVSRSNPLFDSWDGRDPPTKLQGQPGKPADWDTLDTGRFRLTSQRACWEGQEGGLDFWWNEVTSVFMWFTSVVGLVYGTEIYRFKLRAPKTVLKWIAHADHIARAIEAESGHGIWVMGW